MIRFVACLAILCVAISPAAAQQAPEQTVASMTTAEGFEVKLFAAEPMIVNPIAVDVDTYGRVWVTEGVNYRRNVADPPDNKLKVLEDTDGDGVADKMTVFTSDLNAAMGVCVAGTKIYVPESPNLYVYEDVNNDLKPDGPRKTLLTGFGGKNHDHGVHSHVFGPDHKLYMTNGDTGYDVTGPDGRNIKFRWGAMIRCEADGTQLEDFAVNFRNPVELAVDSFGNVWCSDNDNDGLKSVRICWILEGGNYGWFGGPENIRNPDGSFDPIHHWRADKPGFVPYTLITGFGSPCGMTFNESPLFGPKYENQLIHCDSGPKEIRVYSPKRLPGVGFSAGIENIVTNSDGYFRPIDPCVAPDGSIYVTDWYDGGVGGHAYNDPTRGRIYRITPSGNAKPQRVGKPGPFTNDEDALVALGSPNHATTFLARERLIASGDKAVPALVKLAAEPRDRRLRLPHENVLRARALWLLDRIGGDTAAQTVLQQLEAGRPEFRALAVRILRRHGEKHAAPIFALAEKESDGEVLKEILLTIPRVNTPAATDLLVRLYGRYDGSDRYLLETLAIASRGREKDVFAKVVEASDAKLSPRLIDIVRILRPEDAVNYLTGKLAASDIPADARTAVLAALSGLADVNAGKSLVKVLGEPASVETKQLVLSSLQKNLNGGWSALKEDADLKSAISASLKDAGLRTAALNVVRDAGLPGHGQQVLELFSAGQLPPASIPTAIDVFIRFNVPKASEAVAAQLAVKTERPAEVTESLLRGLVALKDAKVLTELMGGDAASAELKKSLVGQLAGTSDGAILLLRLIDTRRLSAPLKDVAVATATEHPDVNVRLLYEKFIPADQRPKTLGESFKLDDILKLTGDVARGESVFLRSGAAACNKCHRVKGKGSDIGPDLSQIGKKYERKSLLETIMNPSLGIAPEYVPYVVETDSGKVLAGFVHSQTDAELTLKTIEGNLVSIPKKEIVEQAKQDKSLMPELVLKSVTAQDAADLLAYLVSLQSSIVHASSFRALGGFPNVRPEQRGEDFGPEKTAASIDFRKEVEGPGGKPLAWTVANASDNPGGVPAIDLRKDVKGRTENAIWYFAAALDSSSAQPAVLHIGSDDGIQIWLNGKKVHDHKVTRALAPGQDQVKVELQQGRNQLLLKLDQGNGAAGLSLSAEAKANLSFVLP